MAGRRTVHARAAQFAKPPDVQDADVSRALASITQSIQQVQSQPTYVVAQADLVMGKNVVAHSLGRAPTVAILTKTVADTTFDYAIDPDATNDRQVVIVAVGIFAQPRSTLLLM